MRIVFAGTPDVAVPALERLLDSEHEVVAVLTRPDARKGRGRKQATSPVKDLAVAAGVPCWQPESLRDEGVLEQFRAAEVDCCPVVAYGGLVPPELLPVPRWGWVNLHFSLLPMWRGAAPVQRAVMAGDELTGACVFQIEQGLDTGPVFSSLTEPIGGSDTAGDLLGRLAVSGAGLLVETLSGLASGQVTGVPQAAAGVSHAPRLTAADAQVVWDVPAFVVDRLIRGCTPAPGAWTTFRGQRLKLAPVRVVDVASWGPGQVRVDQGKVLVATAHGAVELSQVQPAGKRMMAASDWARGVRVDKSDVMGKDVGDE